MEQLVQAPEHFYVLAIRVSIIVSILILEIKIDFTHDVLLSALSLQNQCQRNPWYVNLISTLLFIMFLFYISLNGGSCYLTATGFACACVVGYNGTTCQTNIAATNPCYNNPCRNSGTCQVAAPYTYRCVCPIGYLGVTCEQRVCDPNPCLYGGVCLPYGNSFQCSCPAQYTGTCCELLVVTTAAPNPCSSQPCLNGGTCTATSATGLTTKQIG